MEENKTIFEESDIRYILSFGSSSKRAFDSDFRENNLYIIYSDCEYDPNNLAQKFVNGLTKDNPFAKVCQMSISDFDVRYTNAKQSDKEIEFYQGLKDVDMAVFEDIHDLEKYPDIQTPLFCIFNSLVHSGKRIVFTSKVSPEELKGVQKRLLSRLNWCQVVTIRNTNQ